MTSAPEPLPLVGFRPMRFTLSDDAAASPSGGRLINLVRVNDPVWMLDCQTDPLSELEVQEVLAWKERRRGGFRSVLATQNVTCRPLAHARPDNALAAQTPGTVTAVAGNLITFSGVKPDLVLSRNDLFGLVYNGMRAICRVQDVAAPTSTSRAVTVEPIPPSYAAVVGATVVFENPQLLMRIVPGSFTPPSGNFPSCSWKLVESRL